MDPDPTKHCDCPKCKALRGEKLPVNRWVSRERQVAKSKNTMLADAIQQEEDRDHQPPGIRLWKRK
jgi:hypothetical protein